MKPQRTLIIIFFLLLISLSFGVKLIEFDNPYSGFHQLRQLDNLGSIRAYMSDGIDLSKRRMLEGGYVLNELPIYHALSALLSPSQDKILFAARGINLVFALLSIFLLFQITRVWFDDKTAIYATIFFAFAPINLMYHRSVMIDISTTFFCLLSTWLLIEYFENRKELWKIFLFVIAGGLAITTKALYFLPVGAIAIANYINQYRPPFSANAINYFKKNFGIVISFLLLVVIMLGWIRITQMANGPGKGLLWFLSTWDFLLSAKYYLLLIFRFFLLILNPFTCFLFIIGMVLVWTHYRKKDAIAIPFFIPVYFLLFGNVNFPHEYYSLIMVPYCSIVAGVGAVWLENLLSEDKLIRSRELTLGFFCVFSSVVSVLIFIINFIVGSPNLDQKPAQIEKEMQSVLEDRQRTYVYVNKMNFPLFDYIRYNRSLYLLYALNMRSEEEIRIYGKPIIRQEILYALRQFGWVEMTKSGIPKKIDVDGLQFNHPGNFRYVTFYKYTEAQKSLIKERVSGYQTIYESVDWLVYDLNKT